VSDEAGFLKAMAANPTDSLIPLVYADWFDERNDPRGALLRVWVDLSWRASHAGWGFRDLLDEYRRLLGGVDPDWRREFGKHRPWIDARLAEELARGWRRHAGRSSQGGIIRGSGKWFFEGPDRCGWLVRYSAGDVLYHDRGSPSNRHRVVFVQPDYGWVYFVGSTGAGAWLQQFDLESGQGRSF